MTYPGGSQSYGTGFPRGRSDGWKWEARIFYAAAAYAGQGCAERARVDACACQSHGSHGGWIMDAWAQIRAALAMALPPEGWLERTVPTSRRGARGPSGNHPFVVQMSHLLKQRAKRTMIRGRLDAREQEAERAAKAARLRSRILQSGRGVERCDMMSEPSRPSHLRTRRAGE